jgi:hypothetical protein
MKATKHPMPTQTTQPRHGSVFLLALGMITVLFILAVAMTFFTGSEDYSSVISYESEVAFNLAESAVEEFVARLKYSLNHDDASNQLFKVLRDPADERVTNDIPLDAQQVANLTRFTRETAKNIYGLQFDRDLIASKDFKVEAVLKLRHIEEVKQDKYIIRKDKKEKQGELTAKAYARFGGREARITLVFLIRVVKSFVPPFNYFTLFVKNGTPVGPGGQGSTGSKFNVWTSQNGVQQKSLVLDHGWRSIPGKEGFDAIKDNSYWEEQLAKLGNEAAVPPGRVYLGEDPEVALNSRGQLAPYVPSILLQSTNGTKLLRDRPTDRDTNYLINAQENLFVRPDVDWMGMKTFVKDVMKQQTDMEGVKKGVIFSPWSNDFKIRILNIGAGQEISQEWYNDVPAFNNALGSYKALLKNRYLKPGGIPTELIDRFYPEVDKSGLDLFGYARPNSNIDPAGGAIDSGTLSPTLVYGPVGRIYYRIVSIGDKNAGPNSGERLELPYVGVPQSADEAKTQFESDQVMVPMPPNLFGKKLTATEASLIFSASAVGGVGGQGSQANPSDYLKKFTDGWEKLIPEPLREVDKDGVLQMTKFMSNQGSENYNNGLANFLLKVRKEAPDKTYEGLLKPFMMGFLANQAVAGTPGDLQNVCSKSPMQEFYLGDLFYALPDEMNSYLMDFYFIPRSTEDFFRGRTTVSVGGMSRDRFVHKYINDARAYEGGAPNQVLELNGVLALNDPAELHLNNLLFRGRGVIYSSPMMGGGNVKISGNFLPAAAKSGSTNAPGVTNADDPDMITIIAKKITIDTGATTSDPCFVQANLISVSEPLQIIGDKKVTIKGTVACPYMNLETMFPNSDPGRDGGGTILYNSLNTNWRLNKTGMMNDMYVGKIVTGGVGKFEWTYEHK